MNTSERPEILPETDHAQEHRTSQSVHTGPPDHRCNTQTPPRDPAGPYVPDEGAFEGPCRRRRHLTDGRDLATPGRVDYDRG